MEHIHEEEEFISNMAELDLRLTLALMETELKNVKDENRRLKDTIQEMCINESMTVADASKKKKKWSQATIEKWRFYHQHKEAIRVEKGLTEWRDVKRESDARYYAASQIS